MLNLNNTLDGYLKNVEVIGNTIQDTNNLANIRSVGDKVEGQELYKIELACYGDNILRPDFELGLWNVSNGTAQVDSTAIRTKGFLRIRNQAHLVKRFDGKLGCQVILFDGNFKYLGQQSYAGGNYVRYDNILPNAKYMKINFLNTTDLNLQCVLFDRVPSNINGVEFVEFQESELEILSPVQLEKVGDVVDRIICKDGVWGVESNITKVNLKDLSFVIYSETNDMIVFNSNINVKQKGNFSGISNKLIYSSSAWNNSIIEDSVGLDSTSSRIFVKFRKSTVSTLEEFNKFKEDLFLLYQRDVCEFISLPHDQQVKLRTFAGQTNIAFLTEIPGQIKAQVPKSLGATVNTHTEQIADLHNSLDRVKKLEETTVSTVETGSGFTTVDATNNGYFEDVKLEGKTLVNLCTNSREPYNLYTDTSRKHLTLTTSQELKTGCQYTLIFTLTDSVNGNEALALYPYSSKTIVLNAENGIHKVLFTVNDLSMMFQIRLRETQYQAGARSSVSNIILLEGDHTNNPPSYFEGLMSVGQDVEEVNVESVSANLLNFIKLDESSSNRKKIIFEPINVSVNVVNNIDKNIVVTIRENGSYKREVKVEFNKSKYITLSKHEYIEQIELLYANGFDNSYTFNDEDIYITCENNKSSYVPHQSNKKPLVYYNPTTETWEKPVLREWDSIEKHSDGKYYYHKRSGEVVLNGSESWAVSGKTNNGLFKTTYSVFLHNINTEKPNKNDGLLIPNNVQYIPTGYNDGVEGTYISNNNTSGSPIITYQVDLSKLSTQDIAGFKAWLKANPTTVVYKLAKEEVYECTNIDLMTYSGETNYIINSGAISPKSILKVHNNISNVVKILQEKVSLLENTFITGLKSVLSGDMYSLATILYPEDFEQNDNTEQDIMVIPE